MRQGQKIKVAVIYGGKSGEHEVSLLSAFSVISQLDRDRYDILPVGIDKQGTWFLNVLEQVYLPNDKMLLLKSEDSQPLFMTYDAHSDETCCVEFSVPFDVAFPALHGPHGEDGSIQGMLEMMDIPYVGAGVLASALGMDKDMTRRITILAGLPTVKYRVLKHGLSERERVQVLKKIINEFGYPVFVKPARLGSSVGIHKVSTADDLAIAIDDAFRYDHKILIEPAMNVREIEISVLENPAYGQPPLVSLPGEIQPNSQHEFYSYQAKYVDPLGADLLSPAPLNKSLVKQVQTMAQQIFSELACEGMARIDFFLDKNTDEFYFNEINTIPGFTTISMYPKLWEVSGTPYSELLNRLIEVALARYERKQQLLSDYENKL